MSTVETPSADPRSVLRNRQFQRIWAGGILTSMMRWLDILVLGVFTFEMTDSAAQVAIMLLVRMLPRFLFGVAVGTLADRVNRKHLWVATLVLLALVAFVLAVLIASEEIKYWQLLVLVFATGVFWAAEFPVRRAMIADVVPAEALGRAFGTDWTTDSFNRMIGPALGGGLLITVGAEGAYFLMAGVFVAAALVAATLVYVPRPRGAEAASPLSDLVAGLRYVRASHLLVSVLMVTVLFNMVFPAYQTMIPVIGKEVLGADPLRVGLLSAVEGLGAMLGAIWIASRATPPIYPRLYTYGTLFFFCGALAFSRVEAYPLALFVLFVAGFGFSAFATMQTTILVQTTSAEMRGRVLGTLSLAIGIGPLGALQVGPLSAAVGDQSTLTVIVLEGIVLLIMVAAARPVLRRAWRDEPSPAVTP
ncbi:MAG: MFS transporter [Chloroflexi bacterium]|nr:MFS transporter [Chloroflexota bacterium]